MAGILSILAALALASVPSLAKSHRRTEPVLPATAPLPELREGPAPAIPPEGAVSPPSDDVPVPQPRPDKEPDTQGPSIPPKTGPALPDPRSAAQPDENMPEDELACRRRLKALGVAFEERKAEHDATVGCSIPYPLELKSLGGSIALSPDAEMNCAMAEATARFAAETISPAAEAEFGSPLKSIDQASAYVCRPRHNGRKISEHAFGNALDIVRFRLVDGTAIDVGPQLPETQKRFVDALRKAACGPFKTVLGPGADPDHESHLHLDLEPRRNGGTFCQ